MTTDNATTTTPSDTTPVAAAPDTLADTPFGQWNTDSYGPTITGSGATKLAASIVSPLVATARGYTTLTRDNVKNTLRTYGLATQSIAGRQVLRGVGDRDALLMPWFKPDDVVQIIRDGDASPSSVQYRPHPANAATDPNGKKRKYENLSGQALVLGVHPATPLSWLTEPVGRVLVTEGAIKGDAALTALLRNAGVTDTELAYQPGDEDPTTARNRLRNLLEDHIPSHGPAGQDMRVLIVTLVGVGTWRQNPEWNTLRLKNTAVWVAFDGDIATNPNVWKQAADMWDHLKNRNANPMLVDLSQVPAEDGQKVGIDDFFATGHTWLELAAHLSATLPPRPQRNDDNVDVRMDGHSLTFQKRVDQGPNLPPAWQTQAALVARVVGVDQKRAVSPTEQATGIYDPNSPLDPDGNRCQIEVTWADPDTGETLTSRIEGPVDITSTPPSRWRDPRISAAVPPEVHMHPDWPPADPGFTKAMKLYRRTEVVSRSSWSHMGWVPVIDESPVFIIGAQVIGPDGDNPDKASSAVTTDVLSNANRFGVELTDDMDELRNAMRNVIDTYYACWTHRRDTTAIIALALRPVVPVQSRLVCVLSGGSGLGKTFSEAAIMGFWQPQPDIWSTRSLPGGVSDTASDIEVSLSATPIWVMDDLAPSSDAMAQARAQGKVNEIIRNVFNGTSKGRRRQDMTAQTKFVPRALLVVSAESPPQEQSIINRIIHIQAQSGFLVPDRAPTNRLTEMLKTTNDAAKVTGYALRRMAGLCRDNTWEAVRSFWTSTYEMQKQNLQAKLRENNPDVNGDPTRRAEVIADLTLGVLVVRHILDWLGMQDEYPNLVDEMLDDVYRIADDGYNENKSIDVGEETLSRLKALLDSGKGHIIGAGVAGPPVVAGETGDATKADLANQKLGWQLTSGRDRDPVPLGERLGVLLYDRKNNGEPVVLINPRAALVLIQRQWGNDGHSAQSTWTAVWQAGQCYPHTWTRRVRNKGSNASDYVVRVMLDGAVYEGVPFPLATIAGIGDAGVQALGLVNTPATDQ